MDFTLVEINKRKNNISNLSTKLLSTFNINEELSITYEIKKETEFLESLLNIKMKSIMAQNEQIMQFQIQQMQAQQIMSNQMQNMQFNPMNNNFQNQFEQPKTNICVHFRTGKKTKDGKELPPYMIQCNVNEKVSKVIEKYRIMANDYKKTKKFIYNALALNPSLTVAEAHLTDNSMIYVVETEGLTGG